MTAGIIVITGGAGIRITAVMCRAAIIAVVIPDTTTATTMADLGGVIAVTGITIGTVTVDAMTDGVAVIVDGMTAGAAGAADVMTGGAAGVTAGMTDIADVIAIAAVTKSGEQLQGRLHSRPFSFAVEVGAQADDLVVGAKRNALDRGIGFTLGENARVDALRRARGGEQA
jgi:hypothetical protein